MSMHREFRAAKRTGARFVPAARNALENPRVVMMPAVCAAPSGVPGRLD